MKPTYQFIEPLEPRIAPAILVNGGNLLGGKGNPTTGQTSVGGNSVTLVTVLKGEALVFFNSANPGVITGISVGPNTKLDINGDVSGDIVTNLMPNGQLSDSDHNPSNGENGGVLMPYNFLGLTTHPVSDELGSVGRIIAGGSIKNINVAGSLAGVYAGDGVFKSTTNGEVDINTGGIDFNPIVPGIQDIIRLHAGDAQSIAVPNITNVTVAIADHLQIVAGDGKGQYHGGIGNSGGSITDVTIVTTAPSDLSTPAIFLQAGNGAKGAQNRLGGDGGAVTQYTDQGSTSFVKVETGNGGADSGGTGGAGGSFTDSSISSSAVLYQILVGNGGAGGTGGAGGSINTIGFTDALAGQVPLIATGDFNGDGLPDVLLVNTVTGNATLSAGLLTSGSVNNNSTEAPFEVVLHPAASGETSFIKPEGSVPSDLVAADLNGDGKLDFVVSYSSSDNLGVFLNDGNGQFTASSVPLPASPTKIAVGEYLNNGHADIAVLTAGNVQKGSTTLSSQLYVAEGTGTGAFPTVSTPDNFAGVATDLVSGQLNGAGGTDLAVGFKSGLVDTFLANGAPTGAPFTEAASLFAFDGPVSNLDITDGTLLAFTVNSIGNAPAANPPLTAIPLVQLLTVTSSGGLQMGVAFVPAEGLPLAAHFIGSADAIGVVSAGGVSIYTPAPGNTYTAIADVGSTGELTNFVTSVNNGAFQLDAIGASSSRFYSTHGDLGSLGTLNTLLPFDIPGEPFITNITAGAGGNGAAHNGGAGGSITGLTFTQSFGPGVEQAGARLDLTIATGAGGASHHGTGGAGGGLQSVALSLNPADFTGNQDSTTLAVLSTGQGGTGATGGNGGNISKLTSNSIFDQTGAGDAVVVNAVAMQLLTGNGGNGTAGAGGSGGSIKLSANQPSLSGVSTYDIVSSTPFAPALLVQSGNGGNGTTTGGDGGSLINIQTQNAAAGGASVKENELGSASIISGSGGSGGSRNGGDGGAITNLNVAVQSQTLGVEVNTSQYILNSGGTLLVTSGNGGLSKRGLGGAGGTITQASVASVDGDGFRNDDPEYFDTYFGEPPGLIDPFYGAGVIVHGGAGGSGGHGGGAGAGIDGLNVNSPSGADVYAAILLAGNGGKAVHSGPGGAGGSITGVTQSQDVDSSLNLIQGGNGGAGIGGHGGAGGSVSDVSAVGFIGLPAAATANLGVFNDSVAAPLIAGLGLGKAVPQGVFAGRGGAGGVAGSVIDVVANEIAAIGAAENANGVFAPAHKVDDITADLIGYEVVRDNHFSSTKPGKSPGHAEPIDGFILAKIVADIDTENKHRTTTFTFHG
jgi:hypothetical protein